MELLLLIAIGYAGARGVESLLSTADRRLKAPDAGSTVQKIADDKSKGAKKQSPGPTDPGGTFSAAAPRSAALGGRAAVPLAVLTETGSTMWKAVLEGYREQWPQIRAERRRRMAERAADRKAAAEAERAAAGEAVKSRRAAEAEAAKERDAAAPPVPPMPDHPPVVPGQKPEALVYDWSADDWGDKVQPTADDPTVILEKPRPQPAPETADAPVRRHLTVVPAQPIGGPMSPSTVIPEIRTLDGLLNALALTRAMCAMRAEEAAAVAADDQALSNRLDQVETELASLDVDGATRAEIDGLRDAIHAQSQTAAVYGAAAKDSADFAAASAAAAHKAHGGIAEAVQSAPIDVAAQAGYYDQNQ